MYQKLEKLNHKSNLYEYFSKVTFNRMKYFSLQENVICKQDILREQFSTKGPFANELNVEMYFVLYFNE